MECPTKWNVNHNLMSLKMICQSKWMSLQIKCHLNGSLLKMECHSKWNITKIEMSLKMECESKWNVIQNRM